MDVAELLNPAVETHNIFDKSDEDIFGAVMDPKTAREGGEGGSDEVGNPKDDLNTAPTCNQALQMCLLLLQTLMTWLHRSWR
jgi:hypothetical protein